MMKMFGRSGERRVTGLMSSSLDIADVTGAIGFWEIRLMRRFVYVWYKNKAVLKKQDRMTEMILKRELKKMKKDQARRKKKKQTKVRKARKAVKEKNKGGK